MAFIEKQLGQAQGTAAAVSIYSPAAGVRGIVREIIVSNHEATDESYSIWWDDNGTTYDDDSVLFEDVEIAANSTDVIDCWLPMDAAGHLAVKASNANKLTFTVSGAERS